MSSLLRSMRAVCAKLRRNRIAVDSAGGSYSEFSGPCGPQRKPPPKRRLDGAPSRVGWMVRAGPRYYEPVLR